MWSWEFCQPVAWLFGSGIQQVVGSGLILCSPQSDDGLRNEKLVKIQHIKLNAFGFLLTWGEKNRISRSTAQHPTTAESSSLTKNTMIYSYHYHSELWGKGCIRVLWQQTTVRQVFKEGWCWCMPEKEDDGERLKERMNGYRSERII